jgi:hypothetical protein
MDWFVAPQELPAYFAAMGASVERLRFQGA